MINIKFIMKGIKSKEQEIIKILENSLMNNENNQRKIFLENQILEIKDKKEKNKKHLNHFQENKEKK